MTTAPAGAECVLVEVPGEPRAKGSFRIFRAGNGRPIVAKDSPKTYLWESAVSLAAQVAMAGRPILEGPLAVVLEFALQRPVSHLCPRGGALRRGKPILPQGKPDIDKLARSTLDALAGIVFGDDSQVVSLAATKRYTAPGEPPGCRIEVRPAEGEGGAP